MNILSLFDGMSCAQIAFNKLGIKYNNYFASEIDKHAIKVTQANYPNTVQLGSVVNVDVLTLPKIDLLCGGSPCQSFSFAGKRKGMSTTDSIEILTLDHYLELKAADYAFEGQSYLFWEYMRILTDIRKINPDVKFLLENVEMGEKWEKVLSRAIGVNGIHINSTLLSAQNRERIYWTNIGLQPSGLFGDMQSVIIQPKDKKIYLRDVLETNVDKRYYVSPKQLARLNLGCLKTAGQISFQTKGIENNKATALLSRDYKGISGIQGFNVVIDVTGKPKKNQHKASCFTAGGNSGGNHSDMDLIKEPKIIVHNMTPRTSITGKGGTGHLTKTDGKTYCLQTTDINRIEYDKRIRRLTPTECERLQTVPDGYTSVVSDTQRYKMLGNGWTVDVIAYLLSYQYTKKTPLN